MQSHRPRTGQCSAFDLITSRIAAKDAYVKRRQVQAEAERIGRPIKEVLLEDDQRTVTATLNNGNELMAQLSWDSVCLLPAN